MSERVSKQLRRLVEGRANRLCEYCRSPLAFSTETFEVEHIIPRIRDGSSELDNLALSCSGCNSYKNDKIKALDPVSEMFVPLYHPRQDRWHEHFYWNEDYTLVIGLTPTGRATVFALQMNREGVVNLRWALFLLNIHPPED